MNVCFSGGGIKGYAYIGVLRYFEQKNIAIQSVAGSSIGALMAFLITLGYNSRELEHLVLNLDLSLLEDIEIKDLFSEYGINKGINIRTLIRFLLHRKGFSKNITFKELHSKTQRRLVISACNIADYSQKIFDYIQTPDIQVHKALKASMNIPFIWKPEIIDDKMYIDGCFSSNLPMEVFPVENTIGFYLHTDKQRSTPIAIQDYTKKLITCLLSRSNSLEIDKYVSKGYKLIPVETYHVSAMSFQISEDEIKILINSGIEACSKL